MCLTFLIFHEYARNSIIDETLVDLSIRPSRPCNVYPGYLANGYKFHYATYDVNRSTQNNGVLVKGSNYANVSHDYYGVLKDVAEIEYTGLKHVVLFKCEWYDPTPNHGVRTHPTLRLVEVHRSQRYNNYESFVLPMQATQVYYLSYLSLRNERQKWLAVCCCQPKFTDEEMSKDDNDQGSAEIAFQDGEPTTYVVDDAIQDFNNLDDPNGTRVIVEAGPSQEDNDFIVGSGDDSEEESSTSSHKSEFETDDSE
ncbi:hypothetical protein Syun_017597 [Stephania yunnanensis]|uniref:DUF4216 domain-containing protein n=1 Tax=Stephania yunnanensis TaxID=152371 RepID=A0AAP0P594_9MAGN